MFKRAKGKMAVPKMIWEFGLKLRKSPYLIDNEGGQRLEVFENVACIQCLV